MSLNTLYSAKWQMLVAEKLRPWPSTTMKLFLVSEAAQVRREFIARVLPRAPEITLTVDEWSVPCTSLGLV